MKPSSYLLPLFLLIGPGIGHGENLLNNPNFDTGIDHWVAVSDALIGWEPGDDVNGDPKSGSMVIAQDDGDVDAAISEADCVSVVGGAEYRFGGHVYVTSGQPGTPRILIGMSLYDGHKCTGSPLISPSTSNVISSFDTWILKTSAGVINSSALSARLHINVFNLTTDPLKISVDSMFILGPMMFEDGFED